MRGDFRARTKDTMAKRVGFRCSNPNCRLPTTGPRHDSDKAANVGEAAHIIAATEDGPRGDSPLSLEQRRELDNGIWLCSKCHQLVDSDWKYYTADMLRAWRTEAEQYQRDVLQGKIQPDFTPPAPTPEILTITSPIYLDLVRVPAGEFLMGSVVARDEHARDDEFPPHRVPVPEFYIGQYPVTNLQYQAFVKATEHGAPDHWESDEIPRGKGNHPVVQVSWTDALAFCAWLSEETGQSFRLPTEADWEKAARGADGRIYPWGDEPPDESRCNFGKSEGDTTPIGRYSPQGDSPYGCADMAGNIREWCQSLYRPYPYRAGDGREDLQAVGIRVLRGGSWLSDHHWVRCASRLGLNPVYGPPSYGFRVARGPLK